MINLSNCPVPILQNEWEFSKLIDIYRQKKPSVVMEIGTFYGGTMWYWLTENPGLSMLTCIDMPITRADTRYYEMRNAQLLWPGWFNGRSVDYKHINDSSHKITVIDEVIAHHEGSPVDWLFIDGDHSYKGVKMDFEIFAPLVRPGGIIILHDVMGLRPVRKYWRQLKKRFAYTEIYAGSNNKGWGFGIIEKR